MAQRQISSSGGLLKPASAASQLAKPAKQPFQHLPPLPRDGNFSSELPRTTSVAPGLTVARIPELPHVDSDQRKVSVGWKNGVISQL